MMTSRPRTRIPSRPRMGCDILFILCPQQLCTVGCLIRVPNFRFGWLIWGVATGLNLQFQRLRISRKVQ
ncbi:hypothetical protein Tco_1232481, partial [Tanacetum coccineum]